MTSLAFTSAGTTLGITATAPSTFDGAGYGALTYTNIAEITDLGTFGKAYTLVTHNPLGNRQTVKRKGSYNNGALTLKLARVPTDAGQALLIAARDSDAVYSCVVTLQTGTKLYFQATVMSYTTNVGTVNQITAAEVSVEITNDIVEV
jgi:Phage tail tube protein, TTP